MIHPPHLTLYAIVAATTSGTSLVFLVFVSLYSIARVLVPLMRRARERGEGQRDPQPEKAHRLTTAATSGSISGNSPPQTSRRSGGSRPSMPIANGLCDAAQSLQAELSPRGLNVQAVLPAATRTELWARSGREVDAIPRVMEVGELVDAALVGFDRRETITMPWLPDVDQWENFATARQAMVLNSRQEHPAARYRA